MLVYRHINYRSVKEWLHLRPVLEPYKMLRRSLIGRAYLRKPPPDQTALNEVRGMLGTRPLVLTVSYNTVWILRWLLKFGAINFHGIDWLIADNSSDNAAASEIQELCREAGIHYLRLPFNRFSLGRPKDASLSHAAALNWVWRQVVLPTRPPLVAIIDHDLIPLQSVDFAAKIVDQPFYGVRVPGAYHGWQVWPGYVIFGWPVIERYNLNFWVSHQAGLDTGGANWRRLFRHFDENRLRFAAPSPFGLRRFEEWLHIGNASEYSPMPAGWREHIQSMLSEEYAALVKHEIVN